MTQSAAFENDRVTCPRRLLIVQHNSFVGRSFARYFSAAFDVVEVATDALKAEEVLNDPLRTPTVMICGQYFGPGQDLGTELIPRWRARFPGLKRVIMTTAHSELPQHPRGVDVLVHKPMQPRELAQLVC